MTHQYMARSAIFPYLRGDAGSQDGVTLVPHTELGLFVDHAWVLQNTEPIEGS